jgi:hypothetical protein
LGAIKSFFVILFEMIIPSLMKSGILTGGFIKAVLSITITPLEYLGHFLVLFVLILKSV